ncbi:hypothetical protein SEA_BRUHMOMENT_51 [Arthrobacter phage BruhMoment]|nr:hypothetical protein SEA_BRUHMOMENT_51 [Arthrobacter phage BruhMoment]
MTTDMQRTLSFARDLAHPDWSLSVPPVAKDTITKLLAEIERLTPVYLTDDQLYSGNGDTDLPDGTFVESADGSVWWVEPDFGWDCCSEGSASLTGPARLLVMGGGAE